MLSLEIIFQHLLLIERGQSCSLTGVAGPDMGGTLTTEATFGVVGGIMGHGGATVTPHGSTRE